MAPASLPLKLSYNHQAEDLGKGKLRHRFFVGHVHRKDVHGVFQDIDLTPVYDAGKKSWGIVAASYRPQLPEYADDEWSFANDYEGAGHVVKSAPVCSHVAGKWVSDPRGETYFNYPDAFGPGIDLRAYLWWFGVKRVVVINAKPTSIPIGGLSFDFEMRPGQLTIVKANGAEWDKTSAADVTGKKLRIGQNEKFTFIRNAMMWDSTPPEKPKPAVPVPLSLQKVQGKLILRKTIPAAYLASAVYPVFTDDTDSYYAGAGDGYVSNADGDWDTCHDATDGSGVDYTGNLVYSLSIGSWTLYRGFFPIDTTGATGTITGATLYPYVYYVNDVHTASTVVVGPTNQADATELITEDYDQCGDSISPDEGSDRKLNSGFSGGVHNAYEPYALNATGLSWINSSGYTMLGIREGYDVDNSSCPAGAYGLQFNSSETAYPAYLEIVTEGGAPTLAYRPHVQPHGYGLLD